MSLYEQYQKDFNTDAGGITPPTSAGGPPVPVEGGLYAKFKAEQDAPAPSAIQTKPIEKKGGSLWDQYTNGIDRGFASFDAGLSAGVGSMLRSFQWVADRVVGDRMANQTADEYLMNLVNEQQKTVKILQKQRAEGKDTKRTLQLLEGITENMQNAGKVTPRAQNTQSWVTRANENLQEWGTQLKQDYGITGENQKFHEKALEGLGSSLPYFIPGVGLETGTTVLASVSPRIAMIFGGSASAALEAMGEAGQTFDEVVKTQGEEKAKDASTKTFLANAILLGLTERFGIFNPDVASGLKKALLSMPNEGIQEATQQLIQNVNTGKDPWDGVLEAGVIGAVIAPVLSGGVDLASQQSVPTVLVDNVKQATPVTQREMTPAIDLQRQIEQNGGNVSPMTETSVTGQETANPDVLQPTTQPQPAIETPKATPETPQVPVLEKENAYQQLKKIAQTFNSEGKTLEDFTAKLNDLNDTVKGLEDTVQFHGTQVGEQLNQAIKDGSVRASQNGIMGSGFYITPTPELAQYFGSQLLAKDGSHRVQTSTKPEVVAIDLRDLNIFTLPYGKQEYYDFLQKQGLSPQQYNDQLKSQGYDGLNLDGRGETVIFDPKKVKAFDLKQFYENEKKISQKTAKDKGKKKNIEGEKTLNIIGHKGIEQVEVLGYGEVAGHKVFVHKPMGDPKSKMLVVSEYTTGFQIGDAKTTVPSKAILQVSEKLEATKPSNVTLKEMIDNAIKKRLDSGYTILNKEQTSSNDYRIDHQIDVANSTPASDIKNIDEITSEAKKKYGYLTKYDISDLRKLRKMIGNPDMEVKIYRASPKNELNSGDWVTTSKTYADDIKSQNGGKVYSHTVKASELLYPNNLDELPSLARFSAFKYQQKIEQPTGGTIGSSVGRFRDDVDIKFGSLDQIRPIEFPELVALAKELSGNVPNVKTYKSANGKFYTQSKDIGLNTDLFRQENLGQLQKTMAHEIGHLIDYLPDGVMARGNLMGRLLTLKGFRSDFIAEAGQSRTNTELRDQMYALSKYWKPFDESYSASYTSYRKSAEEIYADFISVLFNKPELVRDMAPTAYNLFFDKLDAKPDVKKAYFELQDMLRYGDKTFMARRERVQNMFTEADQKAKERQINIEQVEEMKKKSLWFRFKYEAVDRIETFRERVKQLESQGKHINDDDNPVYYLEEANYLGGRIKAEVDEKFGSVYNELEANGLSWDDLGEMVFYERIMFGDRQDVANPEGIQVDFVRDLYDGLESTEADPEASKKGTASMRAQLGDEKFQKLQQLAVKYRAGIKELYKQAFEEGLISPELWNGVIKDSDFYAPFKPIKYAGEKTKYTVKAKKGTLQAIENPANTGIEKVVSLIRAMERNKTHIKSIDFIKENFPADIKEADSVFDGKRKAFIDPKDKSLRLVTFMREGKLEGHYVDEYIAEALQKNSVGQNNGAVETLRFFNSHLYRPLFISFNLGFQSFNAIRDFTRFWKNVPDMTIGKAIQLYAQSARAGKIRAFGMPENPSQADIEAYNLITKMEKEQILSIPFNEIMRGEQLEDKQIDRILREVGVRETPDTKLSKFADAPIVKQARGILDFIERTGNMIESMPKIAGKFALEGKMPPMEMKSFIRRYVGSPDFMAGGKFKPTMNEVFLFSNAIFQGVRSDFEIATNPKTRSGYWMKTAQANLMPKLLMALATAGLMGDWLKELFAGVSEYDKTNYTIIPMGKDQNGKTIYFRMPQDETGRLIAGTFWKAMDAVRDPKKLAKFETYTNLLAYAGGQVPSITPTITTGTNVMTFLAGNNPYDYFRDRPILTDEQMQAGGWEKTKPFLYYLFENMGGNIFIKLYANERVPKERSLSEKIVSLPIASNIAGRFIKVSDFGKTEQIKSYADEIRTDKAREALANRGTVYDFVDKSRGKSYAQAQAIKRDMIKEIYNGFPKTVEDRRQAQSYERRFDILRLRGEADPRIDALIVAQSNDEKVLLLSRFKEDMSSTEFDDMKRFIIKNRVVTSDVMSRFIRNQNKPK